ncbi:MAG: hypothetical protein HY566_03545 [Candidatus Kerfeldbacteria bacterium]|nr:hypothetical protein [Candidatus Kerfeldbacteria bacterium]
MQITTTKDILFLVLAGGIVVLAVFIGWLATYLILILRDARRVTKEISGGIEKVHDILDTIKETLSTSSSHLALLVGAVKEIVSFYQRRRNTGDDDTDAERSSKRRKR